MTWLFTASPLPHVTRLGMVIGSVVFLIILIAVVVRVIIVVRRAGRGPRRRR
jgi:hypothetical protein